MSVPRAVPSPRPSLCSRFGTLRSRFALDELSDITWLTKAVQSV